MKAALSVPTEKEVQREVKKALRMVGCRVFDTSQPRRALITPGVPDLIAFHPRKGLLFIECKRPGGKLSEAQEEFRRLCIAAGIAHVYGGLPEVAAYLEAP